MGDDDDLGLDVSLFGEERVNHGGPSAPPVIWKFGDKISISVSVSNSSSTDLMAHHVWQSSMTLSTMLANRELTPLVDIGKETSVVELGAGAALPSLVCDLVLNARRTIATDYPDPNVLLAMQKNAARNNCSSNLKIVGFGWGEHPQSILDEVNGQIDVLIAADTLWIEKYHSILVQSILDLANEHTLVLLAFMHHDHDGSTAQKFLNLLKASGFTLKHEEARDWRRSAANQESRSKLEYGDVLIKVFQRSSQ